MRTTLTLEPDVAALLQQLRDDKGLTFKQAVNQALRVGLEQLRRAPSANQPYRTPSADTGRLLVPDTVCISRVLAFIDEDEAAGAR